MCVCLDIQLINPEIALYINFQLPYGPVVASNTLMKLLNSKTGILVEQKLELSGFFGDIRCILASQCLA